MSFLCIDRHVPADCLKTPRTGLLRGDRVGYVAGGVPDAQFASKKVVETS